MCFSIEIDTEFKQLAQLFKAQLAEAEFEKVEQLQKLQAKPKGSETIKEIFELSRKSPHFIKSPKSDGRVYPNYFAPVIIAQGRRRLLMPMRYRIRPHGGPELPSKYNLFNARLDSLEKRRSWKGLFMRQHGICPFKSFYEWAEDRHHKKVLLKFKPSDHDIMWAPCLWDTWTSKDKQFVLRSFAIITDDPPPEVAEMGHDRCPIFLEYSQIEAWLHPRAKSKSEIYEILKSKETVRYYHQKAA